MSAHTVTRTELYELVWKRPMLQVAQDYGLSDVGLAKICRKHDIPRPPRGFWAKREHGQQPQRTPLQKQPRDVQIRLPEPVPFSEDATGDSAPEPEVRVEVADTLRGAHVQEHRARLDELLSDWPEMSSE